MRFIYTLLFLSFITLGCAQQEARVESKAYDKMLNKLLDHSVNELSVLEVKKINHPVFLDAREKDEYNVSHIKNARWVGYEDFDASRLKGVQKSDTIVIYCSVGYRSEKITEKLNALGFQHVYNLYGGIFEWVNQDNPVYNDKGKTPKVHGYSRAWGVWLNEGEKVYKE